MAFDADEISLEDGRPVVFYQFTLNSTVWRYTSADALITAGGFDWQPAAISDDGQRVTGETQNDVLTINAPWSIGPSQVFMGGAPSKDIQVAILRKHVDSADLVTEYIGSISQINYPIPGSCRITCETLLSTMDREGLRLGWQRACPYTVYDPLTCRLSKAAWGQAFTVLSINGYRVSIDMAGTTQSTGYFDGGFIEWTHPVRGVEFLPIETHTAPAIFPVAFGEPNAGLLLFSKPGDLYVGATGIIYPGCNFTPTNCQAFGNYDNYGGVPDLPGKSPFDGTPVF